jgi:nitrogen fixation protein NifU and related proteins
MTYSQTVLDHFDSPRNVGSLTDADADAEVENPVCGDSLRLWLRIRDGVIDRATWQGRGCAPALAAASVTSELLAGMTLDQARDLDRAAIDETLGGLPPRKAHAAALAVSAIRAALANYETRVASGPASGKENES